MNEHDQLLKLVLELLTSWEAHHNGYVPLSTIDVRIKRIERLLNGEK